MPDISENKFIEVIKADGRYPVEAYAFLYNEGLPRAIKGVHGVDTTASKSTQSGPREQHHVTGRQICMAIQDQAKEKWGMLARTVLESWNIHGTMDFGNMVYLLIKHNLMRKTAEDRLEDFRDVYRFEDAFSPPVDFELKE